MLERDLPEFISDSSNLQLLFENGFLGKPLIENDNDNQTVQIVNIKYNPVYRHRGVKSTFGLELLDLNNDQPVAICGYDFLSDEKSLKMIIPHTPQGSNDLSRKCKNRLFHELPNFRTYLLGSLVELSNQLNVSQIEIISAFNHPKVHSQEITPEVGYRIIDTPALELGFIYEPNGNLVFNH